MTKVLGVNISQGEKEGLMNESMFSLTCRHKLGVFKADPWLLDLAVLSRKVPNLPEYRWSRITRRKASLNSKAAGHCLIICHTQSINKMKIGDR